jgi:hypothetical protein
VTSNTSNNSQFCERLSKGHIIKHIWREKNKEDKDLLTTLKNNSYPKICGILKLQNFKEVSKIDP